MTIGVYDRNEIRRFTVSFTDALGVAADPTTVIFRMTSPSGYVTVEVNNGSPSSIINTAVGAYYRDVVLNELGDWFGEWEGTGVVSVIEPWQVYVKGTGY